MPFYAGRYDFKCKGRKNGGWMRVNPVPVISELAKQKNGLWQVSSEEVLSYLGLEGNQDLILVQREGKPAEICFRVREFVGFTHKDATSWWAPVAIVSDTNSGDKRPVCTFVYLVSEHPSFFAMSGSYGPNMWPDALEAICEKCKQVIRGF